MRNAGGGLVRYLDILSCVLLLQGVLKIVLTLCLLQVVFHLQLCTIFQLTEMETGVS